MIVVDASAILEVLLRTTDALDWLLDSAESLHAPHLLDVEIAQVVRRYEARGELSAERGEEALTDLARYDERESQVVVLRFFARMTEREIAAQLGIAERTVQEDWKHARVWLRRRLEKESIDGHRTV